MLALIWLGIIGFCIIMYVILDGFTLGTGMMMPFLNKGERDLAMSVVLPTWDGNQTWLVLGMASLYGAFPLAFSILLPIFYLPLLVMVVAVILRGVAFEFRLKSQQGQKGWDMAFIIASLVATLVQGYILGEFVQGFSLHAGLWQPNTQFNSFNVITAISLAFGYSLLGATRLVLKTTGRIQKKMFRVSFYLALLIMLAVFVVSVMTLYVYPLVQHRWLNLHYLPFLAVLPFISFICFLILLYSLVKKHDYLPYWMSVILFLCPYIGFIISIFPYLVPYHITLWQAASPDNSLGFILVGAAIMLPFLLLYTGYAYRIFRGKVNEVIHY